MEIWKMGYDKGFLTKDDLKSAILKRELSAADYKAITGEDYVVDLVALKKAKIGEIKAMCKEIIEQGFKSTAKDGTTEAHYSLRLEDQTNMSVLMEEIKNGALNVPWSDSSRAICELWPATNFIRLYKESKNYILELRFYSDGLEEMITRATTEADINAVEWGIALPADIKAEIDSVVSQLQVS